MKRSILALGIGSLVAGASSCNKEPAREAESTNSADDTERHGTVNAEAVVSTSAHWAVGSPSSADGSASSSDFCEKLLRGRFTKRPPDGFIATHAASVDVFLKELQRAVSQNDRRSVLGLIEFPMGSMSKEGFVKEYDRFLSPCVRAAIACAAIDNLSEDYMGLWISPGLITFQWRPDESELFRVTAFPGRCPSELLE